VNTLKRHGHPYIPNSLPETKQEMMRSIGIGGIEELYSDIPQKYRLEEALHAEGLALPKKPLSEFAVRNHVENLLSGDKAPNSSHVFLGAGCWPHYVPAVVEEILRRSEFLTSYTPYQPEISQGMLQALFEYQSMICELTGMEVSNSSMYDWASALGEAARMAARVNGGNEILIPKIIHPERSSTLRVYADSAGVKVKEVAYDREEGHLNLEDLRNKLSDRTAAVYVENPSYLGFIETQVNEIGREAHSHGALLIAGVDPTSLGIIKPPGEYDADIVVGEAQPLGNSMNFGGPLLGIMACRGEMNLIRQMPGRIIGLTTTQDNSRRGFCMALQTREQHIRREKATSNICTNESLCAVASAAYMALLGPEGMRELGEAIMLKANYAIRLLSKMKGVVTPAFDSPHFKEFTVNFDHAGLTIKRVNERLLNDHVHGGKDISKEFPELGQTALCCVTEIHTKEEIDLFAAALKKILEER
jgi:glycine dehydrogenase subunit 1